MSKWIRENYNFSQIGVRHVDEKYASITLDKRGNDWVLRVDSKLNLKFPVYTYYQFLANAVSMLHTLMEELNKREE